METSQTTTTSSGELDRQKSTKSTASNTSMLKRWKSFVKPFAEQDAHNRSGRDSCDNGFEGHWENGVPSVRPRTASKTGQEAWPRALSNLPVSTQRPQHTRHPSNQAISGVEGFAMTFDADRESSDDDVLTASPRPSVSRGSQAQSFETAGQGRQGFAEDMDDDEMGLAQQRRSKRYSTQKSPLSPTFGFRFGDRKADDRFSKSILKRESIRLSALPPMPRGEKPRRSFPAGQGLASLMSNSPKSPGANGSFVFPRPPGSEHSTPKPSASRFVSWTGLLDPERPQNRPVPVKLISTALWLGLTFAVTFVSSALTPASFRISSSFETTPEMIVLASALTVLGFAFGAPIFGALSEKYGRKRPMLLGLAIFAIFNAPVGVTENLPTLLAFRLFGGVFGSAALTIAPAALADLWSPVGRGIALSFFAAMSIIGPVAGAISGSYLAAFDYPSWRWTAWIGIVLVIFFGLPFLLAYTESSESALLKRRAERLRRVTRDWSFHAEAEETEGGLEACFIKTGLMLVEPTLLLPTIHMAFACGVLNLMFVSYGFAFRTERHWLRGAQDLPLTPIIGGCLLGIFINFIVSKKKYTALFRRDGSVPPEARLVPWIIGSWILPAGLLVFAWTSAPEITFVPQLMAGVPSGIGISLIIIGGLNYTVDTYMAMPSLAVGASTFLRLAVAFAFPLFAPKMYEGLGVGWANTTLAIVAVVLIPIPILLMKLGPRFRAMSKFTIKPDHMGSRPRSDLDTEMAQRRDSLSVTVEGGTAKAA